jgi:hypothetical protein
VLSGVGSGIGAPTRTAMPLTAVDGPGHRRRLEYRRTSPVRARRIAHGRRTGRTGSGVTSSIRTIS